VRAQGVGRDIGGRGGVVPARLAACFFCKPRGLTGDLWPPRSPQVWYALQGEMSAMVTSYPREHKILLPYIK
jgi:hypothetical protein